LEEKARIRGQVAAVRKALAQAEVKQKSREIIERLLMVEEFSAAVRVMLYHAFDNEVETKELIKKSLAGGKSVLLPRCDVAGRGIEVCEIRHLDADLRRGRYGIMEPAEHTMTFQKLEQIDLCVVPGVAFDRRGYRIGRGKGFYDVFLARLSPRTLKVGVAFELQLLEKVPHLNHDIAMDMIITERETLRFPRC